MTVDCGGVTLRCGEGEFGPNGAIVSIRPHQITLGEAGGKGAGADVNQTEGVVARQVFLGAQRDYLINLTGGQQLRVLAPIELNFPVGSPVRLSLPIAHCRALPG